MRFYPDLFPSFEHEPIIEDFAIRLIASTSGEGVVSLKAFAPGEVVFAFRGIVSLEVTQYSLQFKPGIHIHDPFFMGKILHHCEPNCRVDLENLRFLAVRRIQAGDAVTMDYESTEDILYRPFACQCGSPHCRGVISGRGNYPSV